ncbi:hypothetical protein C1646_728985, partial [Rhizophagus diaphanus]
VCFPVTYYFLWTSMSTNDITPNKVYHFLCCCFFNCHTFWPFCKIIYCYYNIFISSYGFL